ncbi:MAG: tRNA (N(6)-L-threonylcarbamoyladenosine(37)-C(2))-methylthiotransferase MtaB [Flavobacteriales bacterium]|nr:tRNA (N(6)-L-threonylcarbamoyladenosine(37)-C(2))-methylthiotransferase MtaB [Flavobacteriales bacterium]
MDRTVAFYTLGCKLNFAETSTIARTFEAAGYRRMQWEEKADIYVINTCTVTDNADKRFRYLVHGILKRNPEAYIIAVGCYAQTNPDEISRTGGVDLVLGAKDKFKITEYLSSLEKAPATQVHSCDISEVDTYDGSYSLSERTRAFLKIQDGCDYRCTYCTIPLARGKSRSQPLESVIANAEKIVAAGTYEIVLTGVNTGDWGRGLDTGQKFFDLVKALDNVEGLRRVRISSIEPNLITDEILEYIASGDKFMPHFHIPLQSGCDDILRAMKRRYLTPLYRSRIEKIKELMPHACIGADVIVGFPGETEANFEETYRFISSLEVSYLHVFTYSERENTPAWSMAGSVPGKVRAKRSKVLHLLGGRKKAAFYRSQLGSVRPVLFESENKDGMISGFTDNYVKVRLPWEDGLANTIRNVRLDSADAEGEITCSLVK